MDKLRINTDLWINSDLCTTSQKHGGSGRKDRRQSGQQWVNSGVNGVHSGVNGVHSGVTVFSVLSVLRKRSFWS